jgi:hypothetical protein
MKKTASRMCFMLACAASSLAIAVPAQHDGQVAEQSSLYITVSRLDTGLFDSFNHCSSPAQLKKHASYLAPNLEFYHDKGGVTWTRRDYMAKTGKNVCGHYRRVLIPGTMEVFPIKDYGAIEQGRHKFCEIDSDKCFGEAQFLIVWHHVPDKWVATRIFSYGHQAMK